MASTIIAGLRIAASATGMGVFGSTRKTILGLESASQKLRIKQDALGASIKRSMGTLAPEAMAALNNEYIRLGQSIDQVRLKQERLQRGLARRDQLRSQRADLRSGVLETVAIGASAVLPVKLAIDFESAMADVKKVVDFKTPDGFNNLSRDILELTRTLPLTGNELAAITASGGQLGVAETDLKQFTTTVAKMATAFDMSAADAGDSMAKLANVYRIPISQIGRLGDAINELSNSSPAKASDIVNALGRIGGVAKSFGLTETQAAALSNTFISLGKSPEVAGTAINGMLIKLQTADKQGGAFQEALAAMGMNASSLKEAIGRDAQGALTGFLDAVAKVPEADRMGMLVDLFGLEYADDVAVLAGSTKTYAESLKLVKDASSYSGSMEKEFQARAATTAASLQLLKNGLSEIGINIGSAVLPGLNSLIGTIRPLLTQFAGWAKENASLVSGAVKLIAGAAALKLSFIGLAYGVSLGASGLNAAGMAMSIVSGKTTLLNQALIGTRLAPLITGVGNLTAMLPGLTGVMGTLGGVIAATPIGWLIAGVAGVAVAGLLIYKYWEPIRAFAKGFFLGLTTGLSPIKKAFTAAFAPVAPLLASIGALVRPIIQWFGELLTPVEMGGGAFFGTMVAGVSFGEKVGAALSALLTPLRWVLEGIGEIPKAFSGGLGSVAALIVNFSPLGLFYRAFSGVMNYFGVELPAKFTDFGSMLVTGLVNGIQSMASAAKDSVVGLGSNVSGWFKSTLGINSPSRVFMGYGANVSEGAAIGIAGHTGLVRKAALGMAAATAVTMATPQLAAATQGPALAAGGHAGSAGTVTVHLTQNFTINGAAGNLEGQARQMGQISYDEFVRLLDRVDRDRKRRAY
ncbi:phage tail tape measure protein [Pseudomonas kunmingensis]|uniref:phage tail tape measure protein n=1 Tax=Stutzerimonas kunmingensis TaxID=1211807 RepID=UPI0017466429|nr:phage tail tape measure protein [Stutzerimonas kunmingensis]MBD3877362.1 phage tail tape measure protein [Stutzerimonas kunmingensis]